MRTHISTVTSLFANSSYKRAMFYRLEDRDASTNLCSASWKLMTFQMAVKYCKASYQFRVYVRQKKGAHISLDVEVLKVERMLPDINTDNRDVGQKRILVGRGGNLKSSGRGVVSLRDGQFRVFSLQTCLRTSQPQPEPWIAAVVVLNCFCMFSTEPNACTMACFKGPSRKAPPWPFCSAAEGARFFQKSEWLMWPSRVITTLDYARRRSKIR